jgi:hypothetical protein
VSPDVVVRYQPTAAVMQRSGLAESGPSPRSQGGGLARPFAAIEGRPGARIERIDGLIGGGDLP